MDTLNQPFSPQSTPEQTAALSKDPFHPQTFLIALAILIFIIIHPSVPLLTHLSRSSLTFSNYRKFKRPLFFALFNFFVTTQVKQPR